MTEIKICGITRLEDAMAAADCGADAVGFILHEPSPRHVRPETVRGIVAALPAGIATVGVFVNRDADEVGQIVAQCRLDFIQFHGDETPGYCGRFPAGRVLKAVELRSAADMGRLDAYRVRALLVDSRREGLYGGTGLRADWKLASELAASRPVILAGGLDEHNILAALETVAPAAVDINSGVEQAPGVKDHGRLRRIVGLIRGAASSTVVPERIFAPPDRRGD
jgi:phosphoribosylanthranilate isomerase